MANKIAPRMEQRGGGGINRLAEIVEPAMTVGSNILAEIPAYAAGMTELNQTGLPSEGMRRLEEVSEMLTYSPRTMEGQAGLQSLTDAVMKRMDALGVDEAINYLNNTIVPNLQKTFGEEGAREIGSSLMMALPFVRKVTRFPGLVDAPDYRVGHTAPVRTKEDYNAPLSEMNNIYPEDIYDTTTQVRYYGHGQGEAWESESFDVINAARGNPDMEIEVYRAVPNSAPDEINAGDWVTPSKGYAQMHGEKFGDDGGKILVSIVKAGDLFTDGNSPHEFGWSPAQTFDPSTANKVPGIKAFHGSPHDFDEFSMDQIGTGEGAQAFGHGLYFAEAEATAKGYRDRLAADIDVSSATKMLPDKYKGSNDNARRMLTEIDNALGTKDIKSPSEFIDVFDVGEDLKPAYKEVARLMENKGRMYEVDIDASPDEFLDWDLPLSEQSNRASRFAEQAEVDEMQAFEQWFDSPQRQEMLPFDAKWSELNDAQQKAFARMLSRDNGLQLPAKLERSSRPQSGEDLYNSLGDDVEASRFLQDQGIKGIRYKDGNSRGADGGTSNYVIFDDRLISIAKKYGIAIPAAAALLSQETGLNPSSLYEEENPV